MGLAGGIAPLPSPDSTAGRVIPQIIWLHFAQPPENDVEAGVPRVEHVAPLGFVVPRGARVFEAGHHVVVQIDGHPARGELPEAGLEGPGVEVKQLGQDIMRRGIRLSQSGSTFPSSQGIGSTMRMGIGSRDFNKLIGSPASSPGLPAPSGPGDRMRRPGRGAGNCLRREFMPGPHVAPRPASAGPMHASSAIGFRRSGGEGMSQPGAPRPFLS